MSNEVDQIIEITESSVEKRLKNFDQLLRKIESIDDQKRHLWKEIYENAIADRQNAFLMFKKTVNMADSSTQMAVHGRTIEKFLEKMSKSNDQLIKLAELIARAEPDQEKELSPDDMYNQIRS
jgi:hypothetical protein